MPVYHLLVDMAELDHTVVMEMLMYMETLIVTVIAVLGLDLDLDLLDADEGFRDH